LTLLEAMAAGACVIASDIPANRELIEHGVSGLLTPLGEPPLLAAALRRVVDDSAERASMGQAGRNVILRESWDAAAKATSTVLAEAAGARNLGG
jgi:glycosyltransferase involved in cell wall biosynthesis